MISSLAGYRVHAVCFGVAHFQLQTGNHETEVTITSSADVRVGRNSPAVDFRDERSASWLFDLIDAYIVGIKVEIDNSRAVIEFDNEVSIILWHGEGPKDCLLVMRDARNDDCWTLG